MTSRMRFLSKLSGSKKKIPAPPLLTYGDVEGEVLLCQTFDVAVAAVVVAVVVDSLTMGPEEHRHQN